MAFWSKSINMTIQHMASILKVGFIMRYFEKDLIQKWAENKIIKGSDNISIIELSLIENKSSNEILSLISSIGGDPDFECNQMLDEYYLGFYNESLSYVSSLSNYITIEGEVLRYFSIKDCFEREEQKLFISLLNNDYSLRKGGYSGELKMPDQLFLFLKPYNKFNILQSELGKECIPKPVIDYIS